MRPKPRVRPLRLPPRGQWKAPWATGVPVGPTADNLRSAVEGETYRYTEMYPGFANTAREEGFTEISEWLEK